MNCIDVISLDSSNVGKLKLEDINSPTNPFMCLNLKDEDVIFYRNDNLSESEAECQMIGYIYNLLNNSPRELNKNISFSIQKKDAKTLYQD